MLSNVGEFHDAKAIPTAIGTSVKSVAILGKAFHPSSNNVSNTVRMGMPHLEVYVKDIPIRSRAIELEKLARNKNKDGRVKSGI